MRPVESHNSLFHCCPHNTVSLLLELILFCFPSCWYSHADIGLCNTTHWLCKEANKQPSKLIPHPKEWHVIFSEGAKLNIPLWLIHHLLAVLRFRSLQSEITTPVRLFPPTISCHFQRVWGLIWRSQESSLHSRHIKESGRESLFS